MCGSDEAQLQGAPAMDRNGAGRLPRHDGVSLVVNGIVRSRVAGRLNGAAPAAPADRVVRTPPGVSPIVVEPGPGAAGSGPIVVEPGPVVVEPAPWAPFAGPEVTVSVVLPTLNEAQNLPYVMPRIPAWVDEVLLVDGGSVDGTVEVALRLRPSIIVLGQDRPGKGAALRAGFAAARGDIIVTLDADGSTDPAEMPAFIGCLLSGADFVKGSRFLQGGGTHDMGVVRRAGNWALRSAVRTAFGGRYSDLCYGYNAFWRRILPVLEGDADGFEIETLLNVRALAAGMRVAEVPSYEAPRIYGMSNLNTWRDGYRVLRTITRERRSLRDERRGAPRRASWATLDPVALPVAPVPELEVVPVAVEPAPAHAEIARATVAFRSRGDAVAAAGRPPDALSLNGTVPVAQSL
jgi:hypothetical protein